MKNTYDILANLRDIHLPTAVSWWPWAPGRWCAALLLLAVLGMIIYRAYQRWHFWSVNRAVFQKFYQWEKSHLANEQPNFVIGELSKLLKQTALAMFPHANVAGLTGERWLQFLDDITKSQDFTEGIGRLLIKAPYQRQHVQIPQALFAVVKRGLVCLLMQR